MASSKTRFPLIFLIISFFQFQLSSQQPMCLDSERLALIEFKNNFVNEKNASLAALAHPKVDLWKSQGINCCSWEGITCDQHTGHVVGIELNSSGLFGSLSPNNGLFRLGRLQYLNLADNNFNHSLIPSEFANLSSLTYLDLSQCGLSGEFPTAIFELPKLEHLLVNDNRGLTGSLPEFRSSSPLKVLNLANTSFPGEFPTSLGLLTSLEYLEVKNCNFSGFLPSSLSNLTKLHHFSLRNNSFQGSTAPFFSNLTRLELIDLSSNLFSFTELPSFAKSTHLRVLDLSFNQITAPFPSWIVNLTQLTYINFVRNMIQGSLPSSISKLKNLESFYLGFNNLTGIVELDTFLELKNLKHLFLCHNHYSVITKNSTKTTLKLTELGLAHCNLKKFPTFLKNQDQLQILDLSFNDIPGQIPKWSLQMSSNLWFLNLSSNALTGFEDSYNVLPSGLISLDLRSNFLTGLLPTPPPLMVFYSVERNEFQGEIPLEFCNLTNLKLLDFSRNNLSGTIPQCLGNESKSLSVLNLEWNKLYGPIPDTWAAEHELKVLKLGQNNLQGELPSSLANCKNLEYLDVSNNQIRDVFPSWLGVLPHLKIIILRSNWFHGAINGSKSDSLFPELRIIDLSHNEFSGPLLLKYFETWNVMANPDERNATYLNAVYNFEWKNYFAPYRVPFTMTIVNKGKKMEYPEVLEVFTAIDLSCNKFRGQIPEVVGNLRRLQLLNLSNNALDGPIPPALGYLSNLEALDLSHNKLTGRIPTELTQLSFLAVFNASYNLLTGLIPHGRQFDTFESSSFDGNPGLFGMPLPKQYDNPQPKPSASSSEENEDTSLLAELGWKVVLLGYGCGFLGGSIIGTNVFTRKQEWFMTTFRVRQIRRSNRQIQRK